MERKPKSLDSYIASLRDRYPFQIGDKVLPDLDKVAESVKLESRYFVEKVYGAKKVYRTLPNGDRVLKDKYQDMADKRTYDLLTFMEQAGIGVVVGIKASAQHIDSTVANGCYVDGGIGWGGLDTSAQVLFILPHPDPQHGELALMYTISNGYLTKVGK